MLPVSTLFTRGGVHDAACGRVRELWRVVGDVSHAGSSKLVLSCVSEPAAVFGREFLGDVIATHIHLPQSYCANACARGVCGGYRSRGRQRVRLHTVAHDVSVACRVIVVLGLLCAVCFVGCGILVAAASALLLSRANSTVVCVCVWLVADSARSQCPRSTSFSEAAPHTLPSSITRAARSSWYAVAASR